MLLLSSTFFKINFFNKFFQEHHQSVLQFGSRSGWTFCPNCLQWLSVHHKSLPARKELKLICPQTEKDVINLLSGAVVNGALGKD